MKDPTREQMVEFLMKEFPPEQYGTQEIEREEAIYWFANDWHSGQSSNLYSALSTSEFHPGPCSNGPDDTEMYEALEMEFD